MNKPDCFSQIVWIWASVLVIFFSGVQPGAAENRPAVPKVLEPWKEWVLHGKEEQISCIPRYNDANTLQCAWPGELEMALDDGSGRFSQSWQVTYETRVVLPGNSRYWPENIRVDGESCIVLGKNNIPGIKLDPGVHTVTGEFSWRGLPEYIQVPAESGLVSLMIHGKPVDFPDLDDRGRLWLKRTRQVEKMENRLKIESFRLIDDAVPARVLLHLSLDVAGASRQLDLGPLYSPEKFIPVSLKSPLPARLEQDGRMKVQARPGMYTIRLDLRYSGPLADLIFNRPENRFWPEREIWSFKARPDLRLVEVKGAPPVDPLQTAMPPDWRRFPAYMMTQGSTMSFKQIKRGDPSPAPDQLNLDRVLWLRFDGRGYTIQDRITGSKNTNWRLEMDPDIQLGSVKVDGRQQLITRMEGSEKAGIELRNGKLDMTAESVMEGRIERMPATGWDHDFQKARGRLHLPPGWKLVHAKGMDSISRTWIRQWTLLDFFIVLIFTIALARLYSKKLAAAAFLTLVLVFQEPNAPRYIWIALLAGFALLKYLPDSRFKNLIKFYQGFAVLAFIVIVIPYSIQALRIGIYPQLEQPWTVVSDYKAGRSTAPGRAPGLDSVRQTAPAPGKMLKQEAAVNEKVKSRYLSAKVPASYEAESRVMQYDPKALTQTGPGLPSWRPFQTIRFGWTGPVTKDQTLGFTLIGPKTNLVLAFVRVFLIIGLALGMFGISYKPKTGIRVKKITNLVPVALILILGFMPVPGRAAEIPPQKMLDQLEKRLLEKDECFPACADIREMTLKIGPDDLFISARINARLDVAVPVPGNTRQWLPDKITIDGRPLHGIFRKDKHLWILVPKGRHEVILTGPVRQQNAFQIPFNLKPRRLAVKAKGWSVDGVHPDGTFDAQIQFKRLRKQDETRKEILETGILPPFARVERTLHLGLVWKVRTRVQRLSPKGSGMVMDIPLLPGESVTTQGIQIKDNKAKINFRADQTGLVWESFLEKTGRIHLEHVRTDTWTEIWKVDVSPVYHMEYKGIPVILHKTGTRWYPVWHPWPGETLDLKLARPPGIEGSTLTLEKSHLDIRPGRNTSTTKMALSLTSSQGGQHTITLPENARLQEVSIKGKVMPIRQTGRKVTLPITPGKQEIALSWTQSKGMASRYKSPEIDLGTQSVNSSVDIHLPENRWPLLVGGDQLAGPAVLFWSVLIVIVLAAFGLSRTGWAGLKFYQWFLLCVGMSMSPLWAVILVVAWLIVLDFRRQADKFEGAAFNLMQSGIVLLTAAALAALVFAVSNGLLGHPDMNIRGNGSNSGLLRWYHDVSGPVLPRAWVFSIPMIIYRAAMLLWALWVSFWLVGILKWGWHQFSKPMIWQKVKWRIKKDKNQT